MGSCFGFLESRYRIRYAEVAKGKVACTPDAKLKSATSFRLESGTGQCVEWVRGREGKRAIPSRQNIHRSDQSGAPDLERDES